MHVRTRSSRSWCARSARLRLRPAGRRKARAVSLKAALPRDADEQHGQGLAVYFEGVSVAERFDYDYSPEEIKGISSRVSELAAQVQEVHVAFNNNRSHYAPKAALALKQSLQAR